MPRSAPGSDPPILPWQGAVRWQHVARAPGPGLGPEVRPVFDWLGGLEVSEAYEYPEHRHDGFEVIAVRSGRYRCTLDGQELDLKAGEVLVISPGQRHRDRLAPPLAYFGLAFRLDGCDQLFRPGAPLDQRIARDAALIAAVETLADETGALDRVAARVQDALLNAVFWRLVRALPAAGLSPQLLTRLDAEAFPVRLARAIDAHLERRISLADLAQSLGMSPRGLTAACRRLGLPPPMGALAEARLRRAHALLAGGRREVKQVAEALAFASPFHFSRVFRRRFGYTPQSCRQQATSDPA